jgi:N-acetyl-S-(2-succino)cysteine monooxygenase
MSHRDGSMNLVLFLTPTGRGWAWRSPTCPLEELWSLDLPLRITQQAERARFDAVFIGSWLSREGGEIGQQPFSAGYEPFTLMGALAARTERIGLIGTGSTTFVHPFNMARFLASLDWLSDGRIGWNVVTSAVGPEHYGIELPPHDERYARAQEYLALTGALWDAFEDDAVINDREGAAWARPERIHPVEFAGEFFRLEGQLFMHRSPQGRPVIVQAGQSKQGMEFAARNAEVIFTAQTSLEPARGFYREIKERAAALGRDPDGIKILPGIMPILAATAAQARAIEDELDQYIDLETERPVTAANLQANLDGLDPDRPIPADRLLPPDAANVEKVFGSRYANYYDMAVNQKLTLRRMIALNDRALGHSNPVAAADEVADQMQEWFEAGACDGFSIVPVSMPEALDAICDLLVPELQRRGLARTAYRGVTLRDHLGLRRPASPAKAALGGTVTR